RGATSRAAARALPDRAAAGEPPVAPAAVAPAPAVASAPAVAPAAPEADAPNRDRLTDQLLKIVGERTGYPPDMLDLDVDIEAELGIDSIKRVEILGNVQKACIPPARPPPAH